VNASANSPPATSPPTLPPASGRSVMATATAGVLGLLGYAGLKAHWALGGTVGITDEEGWTDLLDGLTTAEFFGAFWGTVLLDAAGAALLLALAGIALGGSRRGRRVVIGLAALGGGLLGLAGAAGLTVTAGPLLGLWPARPDGYGPMAPWVFVFVYSCFLVFGVALLLLVRLARRTTRSIARAAPGERPERSRRRRHRFRGAPDASPPRRTSGVREPGWESASRSGHVGR
jgi:hypothetical protein